MKLNQNLRIGIAIILVVVIIAMSTLIYKNRDTYFVNVVNVTYFDGCVETFKNGILVTDECTESRAQAELIKNSPNFQVGNPLNFTIGEDVI